MAGFRFTILIVMYVWFSMLLQDTIIPPPPEIDHGIIIRTSEFSHWCRSAFNFDFPETVEKDRKSSREDICLPLIHLYVL